ncbi:dipeptidase [Alphaproteobacteria bacterium]|nr:dipeptidase [Alphaproteobacteria bacterium]
MTRKPLYIDNLQYTNISPAHFDEMAVAGLSAVHVTICYHENFRQTVENMITWNRWVEAHPDRLMLGRTGDDVRQAHATGKTAIFYGFQNCAPIEDDIGLIEIVHQLGARFMQLSYNNQSLLATGCYEDEDPGITRFGKQAIAEMNRVGLVIDMSHSAHRSTLEAIDISSRPISITHANPSWWHPARRNKPDEVIAALTKAGGMLGFSVYPHHLAGGSDCTLDSFCEMIAEAAERYGARHLGIGTDLCQDQPDSVVEWMRNGRWSRSTDFGEGSADNPGFPRQPDWFSSIRDFPNMVTGLQKVGFSQDEIAGIMGGNWLRFYDQNFGPVGPS